MEPLMDLVASSPERPKLLIVDEVMAAYCRGFLIR